MGIGRQLEIESQFIKAIALQRIGELALNIFAIHFSVVFSRLPPCKKTGIPIPTVRGRNAGPIERNAGISGTGRMKVIRGSLAGRIPAGQSEFFGRITEAKGRFIKIFKTRIGNQVLPEREMAGNNENHASESITGQLNYKQFLN